MSTDRREDSALTGDVESPSEIGFHADSFATPDAMSYERGSQRRQGREYGNSEGPTPDASTVAERSTFSAAFDPSSELDCVRRQLDFRSPLSVADGRFPEDSRAVKRDDDIACEVMKEENEDQRREFIHEQQHQQQVDFCRPWEDSSTPIGRIIRPWESLEPVDVSRCTSNSNLGEACEIISSPMDWALSGWRSSMTTGNSSIDSGYSSLVATPINVNESLPLERVPVAEPSRRRESKPATGFHPRTVRILETWYSANLRHPYPADHILHQLANEGGITVKQARKWLANRRVRSFNTLTYNGAVHPKRLRSLQRRTNFPPQMQQPCAAAAAAAAVGGRRASGCSSSSGNVRTLMYGQPAVSTLKSFFRNPLSSTSTGSQFPVTSLVDCWRFETPDGSIGAWHQITPDITCPQSTVVSVCSNDDFVLSSTGASAWTSVAVPSTFLGQRLVLPHQVAPSSNSSSQCCLEDACQW